MAQGKAYTEKERASIVESVKPYLELGFSRNKACAFIGLDPTTLSKWVQDDEALSMKLTGWENTVTSLAMANIAMAIRKESESEDDVRKENSWKWAERKDDSLKPKQDVTTNNKDLPTPILNVLPDSSNEEGNGTEEENQSRTGGDISE
jgi:hypothetical protein